MQRNYCQLSLNERRTLYKYLEAGRSKTEIAGILGRHRSTIFREVRRNAFYHEDHHHNGYFHVNAHELAARRRSKLRKLLRFPALKAYVIDKLRDFWSPDQIAGYLKRLDIPGFYVSHETIYEFIFSPEGRAMKLYRYLCKAFKNRRKRFARKPAIASRETSIGASLGLIVSYKNPQEMQRFFQPPFPSVSSLQKSPNGLCW